MLDQEGVEVDPLDRLEKETPLHKAVRFVNGLPTEKWDAGKDVVDLLLDAGADPRWVKRLIGRDQALTSVGSAIEPSRNRLRWWTRPTPSSRTSWRQRSMCC